MKPPREVEVFVEVPRGSFLKRELGDEGLVVDYVSPLPSPYNYGCAPDLPGEDGDPLDVVVLGPRLRAGTRVRMPVVGLLRFVDAGQRDDKLVAGRDEPTAGQRRRLALFFRLYARARRLINATRKLRGTTRYEGLDTWAPDRP